MRLSPRVIRRARLESRLLPKILRGTRDLDMARRELNWIQDELPQLRWNMAAIRRSKSEPLQYILGSQPFGPLDIVCRPNVLIPRPETEDWVSKLASKLIDHDCLKILDCCSGTGCILLLLAHKLLQNGRNFEIEGVDISKDAIDLANYNSQKHRLDVRFNLCDILLEEPLLKPDVIVSNPPYVLANDFNVPMILGGVGRNVKHYEPKLALVGDLEFYGALLKLIRPQTKAIVFEVGYQHQIDFVRHFLKHWTIGKMLDYNGHPRCVVGFRDINLSSICDGIYD